MQLVCKICCCDDNKNLLVTLLPEELIQMEWRCFLVVRLSFCMIIIKGWSTYGNKLSQLPSNDVHLLFRITLMEHNYIRLQHSLALECIKINLKLQKIQNQFNKNLNHKLDWCHSCSILTGLYLQWNLHYSGTLLIKTFKDNAV